MKYPAIHAAFFNTPHLITAEKLAEIELFLRSKFHPGAWDDEGDRRPAAGPRDNVQMVGRVAVVPVMGVLAQRMNLMSAMSGGTSTESLGATIDNLVADRGVRSILLNIDSPGGSVFGIPELADKMLRAREDKKIVAVANATAASAAYWLASQASELVVTPSGRVGSIGVIAAHTDESKAEEMAGVKTTYITAGEFKGEGYKPLTDESQAALQREVNAYYGMFTAAVAKGRGVTAHRVEQDYGKGRTVLARDALAAGMVDRVATLEATLRRMAGDEAAASSARAARERTAQMAGMGIATAKNP
jgi:signal peptide peptidase SppA